MSQIDNISDQQIDDKDDSGIQNQPLIAQQNENEVIRNEKLLIQEEEKNENEQIEESNPDIQNQLKDLQIEPKITLKQKFLPQSFEDGPDEMDANIVTIDDLTKDHSNIQNYIEFEKDFEKLNQHIIVTHPFKQENGKFKKYSVCDEIGSYSFPCSSKKPNVSSLSKEIGIGPSMFLLTLKQLILFFFCMTVINIPLYCLLYAFDWIIGFKFSDMFPAKYCN